MELEIDIRNINDDDYVVVKDMLLSLYYRYFNNRGATSLLYWIDKFSSQREGVRITMALAKQGIIDTIVESANYGRLSIRESYILATYSKDEIDTMRREAKLAQYRMTSKKQTSSIIGATKVSLPSGIQATGLLRSGLSKCSSYEFKYDIPMMRKYRTQIVANAVKGMKAIEAQLRRSLVLPEGYDYESTIIAVINDIIDSPDVAYTLGRLVSDSRGRAIYECLQKIFNPIANKFARALVMHEPSPITPADLDDAYLFIAELISGFNPDISAKTLLGKQYYASRTLPDVHGDELFELIWVERIYADLDAYFLDNKHGFTTPIELDFSSSNMVIIGLLLGHAEYVDPTRYMWDVPGLSKLHVKKAQTPYVFGSSAPITTLWKKAKLQYTTEQILIMKNEQTNGRFAIANELKDIIIRHCNPSARMKLHVADEHFFVECNRYKNVGDTTKQYVVYDSNSDSMKIVTHTTTVKVPDLEQGKRYFVTGLIHNKDSQIMNSIVKPLSWVIPIHDAGVVKLAEAKLFRATAVVEMTKTAETGPETVYNYLKSINVDVKGMERFAKLLQKVRQLNEGKTLNISPYLLK